jgi:hypothetical protein
MKRVLFSNNEGEGIIAEPGEVIATLPVAVQIVDEVIEPGMMTDIKGFYNRPVKYLGIDAEYPEHKCMIFHIGTEDNLFPKAYYKVILWLSPKRFYITFRPNGGRDFNYIKGQWR